MFISVGDFSCNININNRDYIRINSQKLNINKQSNMQEFEELFDPLTLSEELNILKDNLYILIDSDESISGISLKLIEFIKNKFPNINICVFLILKDKKNLNKNSLSNQELNFIVFQEIARCGEISRVFIIDLPQVISKFTVSLKNFKKEAASKVSNIIENCCFALEKEPLYGTEFITNDIKRISTFGILSSNDLSNLNVEEFYFFNFEHERFTEKHFIFFLNNKEIQNGDQSLLSINSLLENKENCSYSIFESGTENSVFYIIKSTSYVEQPKDK